MKKVIILSLLSILLTPFAYAWWGDSSSNQEAKNSSISILRRLCNAPGAPGFEGSVRKILRQEWQKSLKSLKMDGMKNLIGQLPGSTDSPRILVMAHMDEVGFYVKDITKDGFIRVDDSGGWFDQVVLAHRWVISTKKGPVLGYTGIEAIHAIPKDKRDKMVPQGEMFIDIGATSKQEAMDKFNVRPGLPITPDAKFVELNNSGRYLSKAWDDRVGLAVMTDVLARIKDKSHPNNIFYAATVQEEIGLRGAHVVYDSVKPDIVINLEIGIARDFPLLLANKNDQGQPKLGAGPTVFVYDRSMTPDNNLVEWIIDLAKKTNIPFQYESEMGYGEDGAALQKSGTGVPVINIGIPVRYAHQESGVLQLSDYEQSVALVEAILLNLNAKEVEGIKSRD